MTPADFSWVNTYALADSTIAAREAVATFLVVVAVALLTIAGIVWAWDYLSGRWTR